MRNRHTAAAAAALFACMVLGGCETRTQFRYIPSQAAAAVDDRYAPAGDQACELVRELIRDGGLPGASVAVGVDGDIVWAEGFGWADLEADVPITPATRFQVGSTAKPITAVVALMLHESGRLDLDAPIRKLVPDFPAKRWPITTRQLLGHVGGIRHYFNRAEVLRGGHCDDVRERLVLFGDDSLIAQPGTRYAYSTYGYVLAGAAVEEAAGAPFVPFLRRMVLEPLGMASTAPDSASVEMADRALGYASRRRRESDRDVSCIIGGGGLLSTPSDLVRFGMALLEGTLIAPATRDLLWTGVVTESGESTGYGLGWNVRSVRLPGDGPPTRVIGHGGSSLGGMASFMIYPSYGIVVASATNMTGAEGLPQLGVRLAALFRTAQQR